MKLCATASAGDEGTLRESRLVGSSADGVNGPEPEMELIESQHLFDLVRGTVCWAIFGLWCLQWVVHIISILHGKRRLHGSSPLGSVDPQLLPGVSILKPLTGVDPNLYANLETFFNMNYPKYELLFCIENDWDPAIMVVQSLLSKYPQMDAKLFVAGKKKVGVNPKINNMIEAYECGKYDLVLISDSGLRMKEDTLMDMVTCLTESVGLVHQIPFVCDREGFIGVLEKVYFGSQHAKIYLMSDLLGINCVTGMSCLFRKDVLELAGSLRSLGCYLAEDYYLAKVFVDRGWRCRISSCPALQNAGTSSISIFQARMIRWIKLRTSLIPITALLEPSSECLVMGLWSAWAVSSLFEWSGLAFFFVHTLLWFLLDYILLLVLQGSSAPFSKFEYVTGWLFRELTSVSLMVRAHCSRALVWRNRRYVLRRGGLGEELRSHGRQLCV